MLMEVRLYSTQFVISSIFLYSIWYDISLVLEFICSFPICRWNPTTSDVVLLPDCPGEQVFLISYSMIFFMLSCSIAYLFANQIIVFFFLFWVVGFIGLFLVELNFLSVFTCGVFLYRFHMLCITSWMVIRVLDIIWG